MLARLPPNRGIDHLINLQPGAKLPFGPVYRLSPLERQVLEREIKALLVNG